MDAFKLKINDKYVVGFDETKSDACFSGTWHNHSKRAITIPLYGDIKDGIVIEGRKNLKSYVERVTNMISDGIEIQNFTFIKVAQ